MTNAPKPKTITARDLTWGKKGSVDFTFDFLNMGFKGAAGSGAFSRTTLNRGMGYLSLGEYAGPLKDHPTSGGFNYDDYFVNGIVIKKSGTHKHILPHEFHDISPLIEGIARCEYANGTNPLNKICFLTYRSRLLEEGTKQIAENDWHVHKPPTPEFTRARYEALSLLPQSLMMTARVDPLAVQSEYMVSDIAGSLIQTEPAEQDMDIEERDGSYNITGPNFAWRQAEPYEVVWGNRYTFHCAATPKPEEIGQRRSFLLMTYVPTL